MIFLQYQLKESNTAFRPGVQRPEFSISNEHSQSSGILNPRRARHQYKRPRGDQRCWRIIHRQPARWGRGSHPSLGLRISISPGGRTEAHSPTIHKMKVVPRTPQTHGTTRTPSVRADPMMVLAIASSPRCLRCSSVALIFAISYTCLRLTVPTVSWPGLPVPFSMHAAFFRKYDTVGVFVTKVKDRSGWMVIMVGIGTPGETWAVRALNSLQKSIDLTPRAPRAGPTGGVGAALAAAMRRRFSRGPGVSMK
jgi:hypothetical protein